MKKTYKPRKGITLIELLLTLAIVSIVVLAGYSLFFTGNISFSTSAGKGLSQQDGRIMVDYINRELKAVKNLYLRKEDLETSDIDNFYSISFIEGSLTKDKYISNSITKSIQIGSNPKNVSLELIKEEEHIHKNKIRLHVVTEEKSKTNNYEIDIYFENGDVLVLPDNHDDIPSPIQDIYYTRYD